MFRCATSIRPTAVPLRAVLGRIVAAALGLLLVSVECVAQEFIMLNHGQEKLPLIRMKPLSTNSDEEVNGIEWLERNGSLEIVASSRTKDFEPVLRFYPVEGKGALGSNNVFALPSQLDMPQWSVFIETDASLSVALTRPGSAISPLVFWNSGSKEETVISGRQPGGIFSGPRFIKRVQNSTPPVIAVESYESSKRIALFSRPATNGPWDYRVLHTPEVGVVQQALAVRSDSGYYLFYKVYVAAGLKTDAGGVIPSLPHAHSGSVTQGIVYCVRLSRDFVIVGKPFRPLGDELFFEFDADVEKDQVVILGTSDSGFVLNEGRLVGDSFVRSTRIERDLPSPLSAPAVSITQRGLCIALLENTRSPKARVLYTQL